MNKKNVGIISLVFITSLLTASFVVPKKTQKVSALKEQCCAQMADLLKIFPSIFKLAAQVQEVEVHTLCDFFEGGKTNMLATGQAKELQELSEKMEKLNEDMLHARQSLAEFVQFLRKQEKKS